MILEKLKFKTITESDADTLRDKLGEPDCEICDHSVGNIYMWRGTLDTEFAKGKLCLIEHYEGNSYFALRESDGGYDERIEQLLTQFGTPLYLCSLTEREVNVLKEKYGDRFSFEGEDGAADYIYDAESLRLYKGKKYHSQKNHVNAFLRENKNYTFLPYKKEEETEILEFFDVYEAQAADRTESAKKESLACRRLLPIVHELSLDARVLRSDGKIIGFAVMEKVGNTLMIHIEKALFAVRGVYPMLISLEANAYPDVKFINREEDDGNEGLRRSKQSYNPIMLKQKYIGVIE